MAPLTLLLLSLLALTTTTAYSAVTKTSSTSSFIKSSCSATRYPTLCVQSLSVYATRIRRSPKQIAQAALLVSLSKAKSGKAYVVMMSKSKGLKSREYKVMRDCVDNMNNSVDQLSRSISEYGRVRGGNVERFFWHMSNVQTWVSAALTDQTTCMDGFAGRAMNGKLKTAVRRQISSVTQHTSNALALLNRFASRH